MTIDDTAQHWGRIWKKLLRLTRGRITMIRALDIVIAEETDPETRDVLAAMAAELKAGATLSDTVAARPETFSPSVRELIKAAEKTGAWDEILQEIADGLCDGTFG